MRAGYSWREQLLEEVRGDELSNHCVRELSRCVSMLTSLYMRPTAFFSWQAPPGGLGVRFRIDL